MEAIRIIVVEDERIIALDLQQRLKQLGYQVLGTAASGPAALDMARALRPDVMLMDIHLEGEMDGTEAAMILREEQGTPVVFLTAYATDETLVRALQSHPFGYLIKPVDTRELHATLQTAVNRSAIEQAVARSEQRLQLALDAAQMGVWEWEPHSGRFTTGGLFSTVLGDLPDSVDESIGIFLERLHPDERDRAEALMLRALDENARMDAYFRYQGTDGQPGWLEVHARISRDAQGQWLTGVIKDVTERRRMEEELRRSAAVYETIAEGLFTLDAKGRLITANPAFEQITGYSTEEIIGQDPEDFLHARRHSDSFYEYLAEMAEGHWQGETQCRNRQGDIFPVWESIRLVCDEQGKVRHYVGAITDITQLKRAEEKVNHLAYHDPLTGLPNRMLFSDRLDQALATAERKGARCALMFIDLDGFKAINDTMGHPSGDLLLQTIAGRLQNKLRASDTVARMGGDEFMIVISDLGEPESASRIADSLLSSLSLPLEVGGERVVVTASIGIAIYPNDGDDLNSLMRAADTAMYCAKAQGKNRVRFYTPDLAARASERMSLEQGLRQAIKQGGFHLHYQPQYRLEDGAIIGVEALIRWHHPERGMVPPAQFIPIAEETGLIEPLGAWVLQEACSQVGTWIAESGSPLRLSVNVSAQQIMHGEIIQTLPDILARSGFPAQLLEIEITESSLQSLEDSRIFLRQLREMGPSVAIDDFGTGYSSLSVLKHLNIDRIKIDQSFIRDVPGDDYDVGIVEAIVAMARKLGLKLVAEGVETDEQLVFLRHLACDEVQGYLLGRPMSWEDLVASQPQWADLRQASGAHGD